MGAINARHIKADPQDARRAKALSGTWQFVYMAAFWLGTFMNAMGETILPRRICNFDSTQFVLTNASMLVTKSVIDDEEYQHLRQTKVAQKYINALGNKKFVRIKGMFTVFASGEAGDTIFWLRALPPGTAFDASKHHHKVDCRLT